jgi:predicted nucleic acid-binding protein
VAVTPRYLPDKSALARMHLDPVRQVLGPLLVAGRLASCALIDLEVLYSARTPGEYETALGTRRANYTHLPVTDEVCNRAVEVQRTLGAQSQHRGASLPDLVIAACAEARGVAVLHYDADYDLIASVTGQPAEWVVPRGSVP